MRTSNYREATSEYITDNRSAVVMRTKYGFEVDVYENNVKIRTIKVHDHSLSYAEDCAENWCQKVIKE